MCAGTRGLASTSSDFTQLRMKLVRSVKSLKNGTAINYPAHFTTPNVCRACTVAVQVWIHGKEIIRALSLTLITVLCSTRDAYSCKSEVDSSCNCEMASKKHEQFIRDLLIRQKINCKKMRALKSGWFLSRPEVAVIDNIIYCIGCSLNKWTIPLSGVTNSFSPCLRNTAKLKILALRLI